MSRVDAARVTITHIQCSKCDQWKPRAQYEPKRRTCKECRLAQARKNYRKYTAERLDSYLARQVENRRRNRRQATDQRLREARDGVRALRKRGYSYHEIGKLCGVCNKTARMIDQGERSYHKRETIDRIYGGLFVAINAPLGRKS